MEAKDPMGILGKEVEVVWRSRPPFRGVALSCTELPTLGIFMYLIRSDGELYLVETKDIKEVDNADGETGSVLPRQVDTP